MEKYKIYLCGGMSKYGKENFEEANKWRVLAKKRLETFECDYKVKVTNPNDYFNFYDDEPAYNSEKEVMYFDIKRVKESNLIIVNFNDMYSLGSMAEMAIAHDRRIHIIGINESSQKLHPWQEEMCNRIFTDINKALEYVEKFYLS